MPLNSEGSKKAREELSRFHRCLNSPNLLPAQTYTPSNIGFAPVIAVNQIVALMFSHNYERVPFVLKLAYGAFGQFEGKPVYDKYRQIAFDYLCQTAYFLKNYTELEEDYIEEIIPKEILHGGMRTAPSYSLESQHFENV